MPTTESTPLVVGVDDVGSDAKKRAKVMDKLNSLGHRGEFVYVGNPRVDHGRASAGKSVFPVKIKLVDVYAVSHEAALDIAASVAGEGTFCEAWPVKHFARFFRRVQYCFWLDRP